MDKQKLEDEKIKGFIEIKIKNGEASSKIIATTMSVSLELIGALEQAKLVLLKRLDGKANQMSYEGNPFKDDLNKDMR